MPPLDLLRSLPGLILVAFLPGYLVATICAPGWRWWLRAALAPGLAGGAAGLAGLLYHDAHLRFTAATAAPVLALLLAGAVVRARRARGDAGDAEAEVLSQRAAALIVAASLVAGAATVGVMVAAFHDTPLPYETDSPLHGQVVAAIVRSGDALPVLPEPVTHSSWYRPRTGFETTAALVSEVGGPAAADAMLPVVAVSLLLMPLGIAALAWEATRSRRITALTPLLGLTLPFPAFAVIFGEFPLVQDSTLVVGLVLAALFVLRGRRVRDCAAAAGACVASVWVTHGTEVLTALVVAAPPLVAMLWSLRRDDAWRAAVRRLAVVVLACAAGALLVFVLTRQPALGRPSSNPLGGPGVTDPARFQGSIAHRRWIDLEYLFRSFVFPAQWVILLWLTGIVASVLTRRLRWVLVVQVVMIAALADVAVTGRLTALWLAVYPWSTDDRLMSIQYFVLPMLMAFGVVSVADLLARALPRPRPAAVAAGLGAVAVLCAWPAIPRMNQLYMDEAAQGATASSADTAVLGRLAAALPRNSTVLTEGADDPGQWIGAITPDVPYFTVQYARAHDDDARIVALAQACREPQRAAQLLDDVDAVFVGAEHIADARHPWSVHCLEGVPNLQVVWQDGGAAAFRVRRVSPR